MVDERIVDERETVTLGKKTKIRDPQPIENDVIFPLLRAYLILRGILEKETTQ